jgi:hypothetical protein
MWSLVSSGEWVELVQAGKLHRESVHQCLSAGFLAHDLLGAILGFSVDVKLSCVEGPMALWSCIDVNFERHRAPCDGLY